MNHRRLQRVLFRMQHDPGFGERLLAREPAALASSELPEADLALLLGASPAGITADAGGKRRAQLLRNLGSELPLASAVAAQGDGDTTWLDDFPASVEFHQAIMTDRPLPLALAEWATTRARHPTRDMAPGFAALLALETALLRARRERGRDPTVGPGQLVRAARTRLAEVPAGTFAFAAAVRVALDRGEPAPRTPRAFAEGTETQLLVADPPDSPFRLASVRVEPLTPLVARFLERAERPLDAADLSEFAREHELERAELQSVIKEFQSEGVLLGGSGGAGA